MRTSLVSLTLASGLLLAGCAQGSEPTASPSSNAPTSAAPSTSTSPSKAAEGLVIDIAYKNGSFDPQGSTVKVPLGKPVTLHVTADKAGELHVHSTPEAHVEFGVGETSKTLTFDRPGVIEVESHDTGAVVVLLQVS
jgi:phosphoribosylformylglycinamidine (FGAM) synthase PurS component